MKKVVAGALILGGVALLVGFYCFSVGLSKSLERAFLSDEELHKKENKRIQRFARKCGAFTGASV